VIRTAAEPGRTIIGTFLLLAAMAAALAPMAVSLRSAAVVLLAYFAFSVAGMGFAYLTALVAPAVGLLGGDTAWLIMLPVILSGNLLGMIGLEFAWRAPALIISPLLLVTPALVVQLLSRQSLFRIELPWDDGNGAWVALHLLSALFGVLIALWVDRHRARRDSAAEAAGRAGAAVTGTRSRPLAGSERPGSR
jgi:hypothetical protein